MTPYFWECTNVPNDPYFEHGRGTPLMIGSASTGNNFTTNASDNKNGLKLCDIVVIIAVLHEIVNLDSEIN